MEYFQFDLSPGDNPDFCFIPRPYPQEVKEKSYKFFDGEAIYADYPEDASVAMDPAEPGIQLPDLIGNISSMLVVSNRFKEALASVKTGNIEYLPLTILNHKGRVASSDYFIINSLEICDVADEDESDIEYLDGDVAGVDDLVIDYRKAKKAPDFFRLREDPTILLFNENLLDALSAVKPKLTNVFFEELEVTHDD